MCAGHDNGSVLPPSSYVGSTVAFPNTNLVTESSSELGTNTDPQVSTTVVDASPLPRVLPVVVTTPNGRVLFNAEITLSSNHIISTPSSIEFSVEVVAFLNLSSRKFCLSPPFSRKLTIPKSL